MASQWALVDDQFPHFQGDESVPEQIRALVNYMFVLAEQLRYMLSNLKAENWNDSSLQALTQETTDAAAESMEQQLTAVAAQMEALGKQMSILASAHTQDVSELDTRMTALETEDSYLEAAVATHEEQIVDLQGNVSGLQETVNLLDEDLGELQEELEAETRAREELEDLVNGNTGLAAQMAVISQQLSVLANFLQHNEEDKAVTLGGEGQEIRIVGKAIYFNDELIGGTADETA